MGRIELSNEQRRRIEHEERVRLAEEQYRAEVREQIVTNTDAPSKGSGGVGKFLLIVLLLGLAFLWIKSSS